MPIAIVEAGMDNQKIQTIFFFYLGFRHAFGHHMNLQWRSFKMRWRHKNGWPQKCASCTMKLKSYRGDIKRVDTMTLDHIIPKIVLIELELYELWFDYDNFSMLCEKCNTKKGMNIPKTLPPKLEAKFTMAINRRNNEIAKSNHVQ